MSSNEIEPTCSAISIIPEADAIVSETDEQPVKSKRYRDLPIEIKEMIIKYSFCDWDLASQKLPSCIRGLRGTAADVFYNTSVFDLRGIQIKQLAKMPRHVFNQIRHMAINFRTDLRERCRLIPEKIALRTLHIYQGNRPTYCEMALWSECRWIIDYSPKVHKLSLTLQLPTSIYVDGFDSRLTFPPDLVNGYLMRKKFAAKAVPRISTQLGIEGEGPEDKESRDDLTWVWKAPHGIFLKWSPDYKTIE
ncbi:hypothetical protein BDZ45DRAFT_725510 [Acephala macrosclerotiorum]|nr:hypothetical protein BDZ45DRAFT_725510 [Acephala macrosclerotiorum]